MNRKILIALGIAGALALAGSVTTVEAACPLAKGFQLGFGNCADCAFVFPADANKAIAGGVLKGRWWQAGNRTAHNEGSGSATPCNEPTYLVDDGTGGALTFYGFMNGDWGQGTCEGVGCPSSDLIMLFQTVSTDGSKAYYAVGKAPGIDSWDFGVVGNNWPLVEVPRPRVTSSSRTAPVVTVGLQFNPPAGARGEAGGYAAESILTGYQVVIFQGTGDPGRAANLWTNLGAVIPVTSTGAVVSGVQVTCSGTSTDAFIATKPIFDNGQYAGDYVSASTRIECDPTLADPRFKNIDKSKSGRGTIRPN